MTGLTVGTLCHFRPSLEDGFCIDSYFPFVSFFHSVKKRTFQESSVFSLLKVDASFGLIKFYFIFKFNSKIAREC